MKRYLTSIFIILVSSTLFTSCVKEYNCKCEIEYSGAPGLPKGTVTEYTMKDTEKNAKQACEDYSKTFELNGVTTKESCKLF